MESLGVTVILMEKYAGKETKSQYREIDNQGLINELCSKLKNEAMGIVDQIKFEIEYLQYTTYTNPKILDCYYIVTEYKTYKDTTKPVFTVRNIKTGEEIKTRIMSSRIFKQNPFGLYSILRIEHFEQKNKRKLVNGEWVKTDEIELILEEYEV